MTDSDGTETPRLDGEFDSWLEYGFESTKLLSQNELVIIPGWGFDNRIFGRYYRSVNIIIPDGIELSRFLRPGTKIQGYQG